jgi:hypothetical protein
LWSAVVENTPDSTKSQTSSDIPLRLHPKDFVAKLWVSSGDSRRLPTQNEVFPKTAGSLGLLAILPNPIKNPRDLNGVLFYVGILNKVGISYTFPFTKIAPS